MKRMLIAATVPYHIEMFLIPYIRHFKRKGWRVDGMSRDLSDCSRLNRLFDHCWDVSWSKNPLLPYNYLSAPFKVRQIIVKEGYDLVHVHTPVAAFVTRMALRAAFPVNTTKIIYTAHGFHYQRESRGLKNEIFYLLEKTAGRWTDNLVVINHDDYAAARDNGFVTQDCLHYMPGIGIDTDHYSRPKVDENKCHAVRNEIGLKPEDKLLLLVARFDPGKRHADALKALAQLGRNDIHLAFAGDGPLCEVCAEMAVKLNIEKQVHFLGFRLDIKEWICAANLVILPSSREGLPVCLLEAQALGTPCIGTNIRGIRDLLEGDRGVLYETGDVIGLSVAITRLLDHPSMAKDLARRAREGIHRYDLEHILQLHENLYSEALAS